MIWFYTWKKEKWFDLIWFYFFWKKWFNDFKSNHFENDLTFSGKTWKKSVDILRFWKNIFKSFFSILKWFYDFFQKFQCFFQHFQSREHFFNLIFSTFSPSFNMFQRFQPLLSTFFNIFNLCMRNVFPPNSTHFQKWSEIIDLRSMIWFDLI